MIMHEKKLHKGKLLKRYKRFFADIEFQGQQIIAHVPNTGSLKSCLFPGQNCFFSDADNPERKLKYTLEILETPTGLVGVNTQTPNLMMKKAIEAKLLDHWKNFDIVKPEFKINSETRLDFKLENSQSQKSHFIEVKNVSLMDKGIALFPDAETTRGQKHIKELVHLMELGHSCEIVFFVQRSDVHKFSPASEIDPEYAKLLKLAAEKGLIISPIVCSVTEKGIILNKKVLPVEFR